MTAHKLCGMANLRQTTAFGPGVYRGNPFSRERLQSFVDGSNKAIAAGISIPLLRKHAKINATDKETEQFAKEEGQGVGWVKKYEIGPDGALIWEAENVPDDVAQDIETGVLKLTSPEFRNHYESEKAGVYSGPIIRHMAFTPLAGNPHQGKIEVVRGAGSNISALALAETQDAWQFAEEEREPFTEQQFNEGVLDEDLWQKAKEATDRKKYPDDDQFYAVVTSVYKKMGGRYKADAPGSQHTETPPKETGTVADQYSEDTWTLPFADFLPWLQEDATEQFAHREPVDHPLASELLAVHSYVDQKGASPNKYGFIGQQHGAIVKNLDKKKAKGVYDHEKTKKLFGYYAKSLSDHYVKHHGGSPANPATRHHVATILADHYHHGTEAYTESKVDAQQFADNPGVAFKKGHSIGRYIGEAGKAHEKFLTHLKAHGGTDTGYAGHFYIPDDKRRAFNDNPESGKHKYTFNHAGMHLQYAEDNDKEMNTPLPDKGEAQSSVPPATDPDPMVNPDMPPKTPDRNKLVAILAGLKQKNIVLPSDYDFTKEGALDVLLGCINSSIQAENQAKAEAEPADPDNEQVTDSAMPFSESSFGEVFQKHGYKQTGGNPHSPTKFKIYSNGQHSVIVHNTGNWRYLHGDKKEKRGNSYSSLDSHLNSVHSTQHTETKPQASTGDYIMQFTEEEIAALPPSLKAKLDQEVAAQKKKTEEAELKAAQFAEEKKQQTITTARNNSIAAIKASPLPPALKNELVTGLETAQFSEEGAQPTLTHQQVAELFTKFIPKHLQFCEEDTTTSAPPKGKRQVGTDGKGNPIFEGEMGEQFFESGELAPGHVTAERANEIVNSSPVMAAQRRNSRKQSVGEEVATLNANKSW